MNNNSHLTGSVLDVLQKSQPAAGLFSQPWYRRHLLYYVTSIIMMVAAVFGVVDAGAASKAIEAADSIPGVFGALVLLLAGARTHHGSDSRATDDDVTMLIGKIAELEEKLQGQKG